MKILFLDDNDHRVSVAESFFKDDRLIVAKTALEAIFRLEIDREWEVVMLDHDLGGEKNGWEAGDEPTGMMVVDWIIRNRPTIQRVVVHSWNAPAALEMTARLRDAGYNARWARFAVMV